VIVSSDLDDLHHDVLLPSGALLVSLLASRPPLDFWS